MTAHSPTAAPAPSPSPSLSLHGYVSASSRTTSPAGAVPPPLRVTGDERLTAALMARRSHSTTPSQQQQEARRSGEYDLWPASALACACALTPPTLAFAEVPSSASSSSSRPPATSPAAPTIAPLQIPSSASQSPATSGSATSASASSAPEQATGRRSSSPRDSRPPSPRIRFQPTRYLNVSPPVNAQRSTSRSAHAEVSRRRRQPELRPHRINFNDWAWTAEARTPLPRHAINWWLTLECPRPSQDDPNREYSQEVAARRREGTYASTMTSASQVPGREPSTSGTAPPSQPLRFVGHGAWPPAPRHRSHAVEQPLGRLPEAYADVYESLKDHEENDSRMMQRAVNAALGVPEDRGLPSPGVNRVIGDPQALTETSRRGRRQAEIEPLPGQRVQIPEELLDDDVRAPPSRPASPPYIPQAGPSRAGPSQPRPRGRPPGIRPQEVPRPREAIPDSAPSRQATQAPRPPGIRPHELTRQAEAPARTAAAMQPSAAAIRAAGVGPPRPPQGPTRAANAGVLPPQASPPQQATGSAAETSSGPARASSSASSIAPPTSTFRPLQGATSSQSGMRHRRVDDSDDEDIQMDAPPMIYDLSGWNSRPRYPSSSPEQPSPQRRRIRLVSNSQSRNNSASAPSADSGPGPINRDVTDERLESSTPAPSSFSTFVPLRQASSTAAQHPPSRHSNAHAAGRQLPCSSIAEHRGSSHAVAAAGTASATSPSRAAADANTTSGRNDDPIVLSDSD